MLISHLVVAADPKAQVVQVNPNLSWRMALKSIIMKAVAADQKALVAATTLLRLIMTMHLLSLPSQQKTLMTAGAPRTLKRMLIAVAPETMEKSNNSDVRLENLMMIVAAPETTAKKISFDDHLETRKKVWTAVARKTMVRSWTAVRLRTTMWTVVAPETMMIIIGVHQGSMTIDACQLKTMIVIDLGRAVCKFLMKMRMLHHLSLLVPNAGGGWAQSQGMRGTWKTSPMSPTVRRLGRRNLSAAAWNQWMKRITMMMTQDMMTDQERVAQGVCRILFQQGIVLEDIMSTLTNRITMPMNGGVPIQRLPTYHVVVLFQLTQAMMWKTMSQRVETVTPLLA
jgi:hypothetical protein